MKSWFNSSELVGLPGMPTTASSILRKAKRENWKSRKHTGLGGGNDYHITALPDETRAALTARFMEYATPKPGSSKPVKRIKSLDISTALKELSRLQTKQEALQTESKRLLDSIISICELDTNK